MLLLLRRPGGSALAAAAAACLIAVQFVDLGAARLQWLTTYYVTVGGLVIIGAVVHGTAWQWPVHHGLSRERGDHASR